MAITFTCQCGKRLSAPDEAQGRVSKCPKCGAKVVVPHAVSAAPQASQPPPSSPAPQSACPGCGAVMPNGAVICVHCGYNAKLGRRMEPDAAEATRPPSVPSPVAQSLEAETSAGPRSRSDRRGWIVLDTGLAICYSALIVGCIALAVISLFVVIGIADPSSLVSVFGGPGAGRFVAMVLPWCVVAALVSSVVLVTGWFVCCGIPEKARARQLIQGSVACAGIALSMIVVLQVLAVVVTPPAPKIPSFTDPRRPPTDAEMRTAQSEFKEAQMKSASAARTVATTGKVLIWLAVMAWAAGVAVFGLFVAAASEHLGDSRLRPWSYAVAGVQGVIALCMTLFLFEVVSTSPTIVKYLAILSTVLHPVAYAGLIYMVSQARREVPAG